MSQKTRCHNITQLNLPFLEALSSSHILLHGLYFYTGWQYVWQLTSVLGKKKICLFALHCPRLFFDPRLNFFNFFFFLFYDKTHCFQSPKLDDSVNLFCLMCTKFCTNYIYLSSYMLCTISLWTAHLVDFPATIAKTVGQCCVWTVKKKTQTTTTTSTSARPPNFQICVEGKQTFFFLPFKSLHMVTKLKHSWKKINEMLKLGENQQKILVFVWQKE